MRKRRIISLITTWERYMKPAVALLRLRDEKEVNWCS